MVGPVGNQLKLLLPSARIKRMDKSRTVTPLLIAILFLVLPLLYLGSYFALVLPRGAWVRDTGNSRRVHYRHYDSVAQFAYWPVEQIDRRVRPREWDPRPMTVNEFLSQPRPAP